MAGLSGRRILRLNIRRDRHARTAWPQSRSSACGLDQGQPSSQHEGALRSVGGNLRALFCFDPRRTAIVLLGGDKTNHWAEWYDENIPIADDLYDVYLTELKEEGLL
jgi:hypothetical protein